MARSRRDTSDTMGVRKEIPEDLFSGHQAFEIPYFQRSYVWDEEQWERFLDDMVKVSQDDKGYFMGFVVLKAINAHTPPLLYSVIDGQQRLTTFLVFSRVMCEIDEYNEELIKFEARDGKIILEHNYSDKNIFEPILEGNLDKSLKNAYKENKVLQCYNYFKNEAQKEKISQINFETVMKKLFFICMFLMPEDDEQEIFDTMNSLGVSLTTSELLKNLLFDRDDEELYENTWLKTFEEDEETKNFWNKNISTGRSFRKHIDLLLQSYITIKEAENKAPTTIRVSEIFKRYQNLLNEYYSSEDKKTKFIKELMEYATVYAEHIQPDADGKLLNDEIHSQRINLIIFTLELTSIIPYIIYILKNVESEQEQKAIFDIIENYTMRRFIAGESTKSYNKQFIPYIKNEVKTADDLAKEVYNHIDPSITSSYFPDDEKLLSCFENSTFINRRAKIILFFLEHQLRTDKHTTQLRSLSSYQVEHVMPRNWTKHWANMPEGIEESERNHAILKIGNLTLLTSGLNSSLKNLGWIEKRDGKTSPKNLKGFKDYCKEVETFSKYLGYDSWDENVILERSKELFEIAKDLWKFDPPPKDDKEE